VVRYDRTVPPGGVGKITLQVNTKGFQGRITKSARLTTNDPKLRKTSIYLSMDVRPYIFVEPAPRLSLRGVVGDDIRQVLRIRPGDDHPLEIGRVETNLGSVIDYKLNRKEGSQQYELEVIGKVNARKVSSGFLALYTNHPNKKVLRVPVHVRIRPLLEARPNQVAFQNVSKVETPKGGFKRVITVVNNKGKTFRLQQLQYNEEYFKVRPLVPTDKPASRYKLEVAALMDQLPAGRIMFRDTMIIKTDIAQAGELKVPMWIKVKTEK